MIIRDPPGLRALREHTRTCSDAEFVLWVEVHGYEIGSAHEWHTAPFVTTHEAVLLEALRRLTGTTLRG